MFKYLYITFIILFFSCSGPERVWNNPNDSETELEPEQWKVQSISQSRISVSEIRLDWQYAESNIQGFLIEKKINNLDWQELVVINDLNLRSYIDTLAVNYFDNNYQYRISAFAGQNYSEVHYTITEEYQSLTPPNLYPTSYKNDILILEWSMENSDDFFSYGVFEVINENNEILIKEIFNRSDTTLSISDINYGAYKYYKVKLVDRAGFKSISNIVMGYAGYEFSRLYPEGYALYDTKLTSDGGYISTGTVELNVSMDLFLLKTNFYGEIEWYERDFGGAYDDYGFKVQQTADGGYVTIGQYSYSNYSNSDIWVKKVTSSGYEEWERFFGENGSDEAGFDIKETLDGGYIILGNDRTENTGIKLIKLNSYGNVVWDKKFGGVKFAYDLVETDDGGYLLASNVNTTSLGYDGLLIKVDFEGELEWEKVLESFNVLSAGNSLIKADDGGYLLVGKDFKDVLGVILVMIKFNSDGEEEWRKTDLVYEPNTNWYGNSIGKTNDGGYIIAGSKRSHPEVSGFLLKTSMFGDLEWLKTYGNSHILISVQQLADGKFLAGGQTTYDSGQNPSGWLLKTDAQGNTVPIQP